MSPGDCCLTSVQIKRVQLSLYRTLDPAMYKQSRKEPSFYFKQIGCQLTQPNEVAYEALMSLYAISRARV